MAKVARDVADKKGLNQAHLEKSATLPLQIVESWTEALPHSKHVEFFKQTDWGSTPLGPLETWGPFLRFATNLVFHDCRPACVYWGAQLTALYNEKWIEVIAGAHPKLMGNPFWVGFPDAWADMQPLFETALNDGQAVEFPRIELSILRNNNFVEEAYFNGHLMPLRGDGVRAEGVYNTGYENTTHVLYERRRSLLNLLSALPDLRVSQMFPRMSEILQTNGRDISMALIYSTDVQRVLGNVQVTLQMAIGVPKNHSCAPTEGIIGQHSTGFLPFFDEIQKTGKSLLLLESDGSLQQRAGHLLVDIEWCGWGEKCRDLSILPLLSSAQLIGFMVIATNPRRHYDGNSAQFVHDLTQQIEVKWGSAITTENALKREESLAKQLRATEERIRHMAQHAPVGMIHLSLEAKILWANEQWYEITSHRRDGQPSTYSWLDCYADSSRQQAQLNWQNLMQGFNTSCELKLRRLFRPPIPDDVDHHVWVNALGFPARDEDGKVKYVMGTLTDVSHLKWAESVQTRSAQRADEAKRRQEEFIDITSHEMRNPLSAIYQCASMISTSLTGITHNTNELLSALENNVEIATTILTCAAHQKRIIDDVLILNRLENMMLSITPVPVHLPQLINHISKMFQVELTADRMDLEIIRHRSYDEHNIELVNCDPSRLTQIFINLITNAIKFTRAREERKITLTYGASTDPPDNIAASMTGTELYWPPSTKHHEDLTAGDDWGTGETLYLRFAVQDTGPGLEPIEVQRLFTRFSQANAKTHIEYGGSGLGLYISRELTEKQGGRIGIASTPNVGTVIAFYVKSKRGQVDLVDTQTNDSSSGRVCHPIKDDKNENLLSAKHRNVGIGHVVLPLIDRNTLFSKRSEKVSILLAEDNLINQRILKKQLQQAAYEVHVANHGLEVLDLLKKSSAWMSSFPSGSDKPVEVDVILMDWEMPQMDGLSCSREIRAWERAGWIRRIPIIAITANARSEQIQTALLAGIDDVLTKPFLVPDLTNKIQQWLDTVES